VWCSSSCLTPYIRVQQSCRVLFSVPYHSSVNHTKANVTFFRPYCSLLCILGSRSCFGFSAIVCLCQRTPLVVIVLVQEYRKGLVNRVHSLTEVLRYNAVFGPACSSSGTLNKVGNKSIVHFHQVVDFIRPVTGRQRLHSKLQQTLWWKQICWTKLAVFPCICLDKERL